MTTVQLQEPRSEYHAPVLMAEVLELLAGAGRVLDGTLGGGGHTRALLECGATVDALDRDADAIADAAARLAGFMSASQLRLHRGNFADASAMPALAGARFDGILLDLGVSSHQLDEDARGFTFRAGAPLDMRMGDDAPWTAAALLAQADEADLTHIFRDFADERHAAGLAREIVRRRATRPLRTSDDLVGAIRATLGARSGPGEFARLFQGVRIAVNDELTALDRALPALRDLLVRGGRLVIISYHSGEDRLVKHAFRDWCRSCICPPRLMVCQCRGRPLGTLITRKAVVASPAEIAGNSRARSARLRAWRSAE
ncbi:MAG: 16S rRNA (cytosine(1402)-N(4))-methyltransferase RsmH [Gemmatimonadaceae bacterium]